MCLRCDRAPHRLSLCVYDDHVVITNQRPSVTHQSTWSLVFRSQTSLSCMTVQMFRKSYYWEHGAFLAWLFWKAAIKRVISGQYMKSYILKWYYENCSTASGMRTVTSPWVSELFCCLLSSTTPSCRYHFLYLLCVLQQEKHLQFESDMSCCTLSLHSYESLHFCVFCSTKDVVFITPASLCPWLESLEW